MPNKRRQPLGSSDINSSGQIPASKRLCVEVPEKSGNNNHPCTGVASANACREGIASKHYAAPDSNPDGYFDVEGLHESAFDKLRLSIVASLERHPRATSHPDVDKINRLKSSDDVSKFLSAHGWWKPAIVTVFRDSQITVMSLSSSIKPLNPVVALTERLFRQEGFVHLSSLSLAGTPLSHVELLHLRLLPALRTLDLASTSISTVHLLHLATHASSLCNLNISSNPSIDDDARVPLLALTELASLHLRGTSITIPCLHLLVYSIPSSCRFITLPSGCLHYLNTRFQRYCVTIPTGYVQDPRGVPSMNIENLKRNLELHKAVNKDVSTAGNRADLVQRLMALLCGRVADGRIAKRVGRIPEEKMKSQH